MVTPLFVQAINHVLANCIEEEQKEKSTIAIGSFHDTA
jgi:hypothetical protein